MRPAWRLAISSLSARGSRSALLAGTVALSAALVAAIACAMNSVQVSARAQMHQLVGEADAAIAPAGRGQLLRASLLDEVRAWPGVAGAQGVLKSPVTVTASYDVLEPDGAGGARRAPRERSVTALAFGHQPGAEPPLDLLEGRLPSAPGEIVIDATLAAFLSAAAGDSATMFDLPGRVGGQRTHLTGPHPSLPERVGALDEAARLNEQVGVRVGDVVEVSRRVLPDVDLSKVRGDPEKAAAFARATGVGVPLDALGGLLRRPVELTVVGVAKAPPLGGRATLVATIETVESITGSKGRLSEIGLTVAPGVDPDALVAAHRESMPRGVLLRTSAKVSSKLDENIEASRLGFLLATTIAFFSAAFIITTGMCTALAEKRRELGVLRCVGASRGQLAQSQLLVGLLIGGMGALVGVPLGVGVGAGLVEILQTQIEVSLHVPAWGAGLALGGAVVCGLIGAVYPAWSAARVSPLQAMAARSEPARAAGVRRVLVAGLLLAGVPLAIVTFTTDGQVRFWSYVFLGLPTLFLGYFLLAVPGLMAVTAACGPLVSRVFALPPHLLARTIRATPYRYGFTAGSMMMGLALMVSIWTQGGAVQRDWLDRLTFPDAFVTGFDLDEAARQEIERIEGVTGTCAITIHPVETDAFGVRALQTYTTAFIAFEPEAFFRMVNPVWVQGDRDTATRRLNEGGAVIVAKEFMIAKGMGVGDTFVCREEGNEHRFEIVGVVTSPGLEVVSQFFAVGENFADQSVHAVFGSRSDLRERFGVDAVHLVQVELADDADDERVLGEIRTRLADAGILDVGSGRQVKDAIRTFVKGGLLAFSLIAVVAMIIAGLGVANLIIAGVTARQFEFGVLRAVGAHKHLVTRLVLGEAALVGLTAAFVGTIMGLQGVYAVQRIDQLLLGVELRLRPPPGPIAMGWGITLAMTLLAAAPAVLALARKGPRELLAAMKG
ncbi:MAG: ABC transporter permease [Planctomycetota bacterium]|nr:ABC transporter permease [Planctomycetota bacterium]